MKYFVAIWAFLVFISCIRNTYNVHVDEILRKELVAIEVYSTESDQKQIVYSNGKANPHTTYYGENDWSVFYKGHKVFNYREFVLSRNDVASYDFYLSKIVDSIFVEMLIDDIKVND